MTTAPSAESVEDRVLVLAPIGRDGPLACAALREGGVQAHRCLDMPSLLQMMSEGAGAVLIAEEALSGSAVVALAAALGRQPPWSDLPIVVISNQSSSPSTSTQALARTELLGHVTLIDRPARPRTLVTVVRTALRARRRQYEARDLLERLQQSRAQLDTTRSRADYAARISGVGFWYCDLPFDELLWDARVKEHFFLPPDARVTIDTFYDRILPEDREPTRAAIGASIRDHEPYDIIYRTHHPESGAVRWVRALGGTAYGADGAPTHFDGVTVDVSAQKQAEEQHRNVADRERRALLAAEEAVRAKDDFLAMLGHELRNPLAPITTAVHLLKLRSPDGVPREVGVIAIRVFRYI